MEQASADIAAVRALLPHGEVSDAIVGFHAQQAAEKLLKAVLTARDQEFPRTHSLRALLDLVADSGSPVPAALEAVQVLYPFAVQFRYEALPTEEPLERKAAATLVSQLEEWALGQLDSLRD